VTAMGNLTKNFSAWEFACNHCGEVKVMPELVERLQALRDVVDLPVVLSSGYRCPLHPKANPQSQHSFGKAADCTCSLPLRDFFLAGWRIFGGYGGVGLYDEDFLHLDVGPPRTWGRLHGVYVDMRTAQRAIFGEVLKLEGDSEDGLE